MLVQVGAELGEREHEHEVEEELDIGDPVGARGLMLPQHIASQSERHGVIMASAYVPVVE